ncbi:nickel/cobalt transporter [Leptolyngbya sp. FACHB-261]|uniref:nickel/cobalt transporter n=1 Tax=Leptolyngbya sp. FACHB-261 TaxID=2692806 RepID=UPI001688EE9F|nr:sulfite exporter TauE/SafE family protein [Leptolyngbya sp. FACHB-261]MBD2102830.1 sulfite exporter TauE/SafE family protein [Leptolyngbya sp. FACHB-261]
MTQSLWHRVFAVLWIVVGVCLVTPPAFAHPGHGDFFAKHLLQQTLTPSLALTGLGLAFLFGVGHALSPGHGKTMVAAYLVGKQGTPQQAILLGLVTTFTHTIAVFLLGIVASLASQYIVSEALYPILSLLSGLTVCGVGFWLLDQRLSEQPHSHSHSHDHEYHDHGHHDHDHHHLDHHHHSQQLGHSSVLGLGIAGGIIPCPSGLVLMLSAIALHQVYYGLALVSAFSLGLASVLIALGLVVVYLRQWLDHFPASGLWLERLSLFSAGAVIVAGSAISAMAVM